MKRDAGHPPLLELYPPRTEQSAAGLPAELATLAATAPAYFSVTYGAGGSSTEASLDLVRLVAETTGVDVMPHLTCVGASVAGTAELVRRLLDLGAQRFLAIRGDRPEGAPEPGLRSAAELVQLIRRVQAERANWGAPAPKVEVAVAAFVNGHPESRARTDHLDALLAKQVAGADLAITQLFFHPEDYVAFVDRARRWGITIPIVPGVLPVTSPARLHRMLELSGEDEPYDLAIALEVEPTAEGRYEIGVDHAARFARTLIDAGAPALHLYTFNRADAVVAVLDRLGLASATTKRTT